MLIVTPCLTKMKRCLYSFLFHSSSVAELPDTSLCLSSLLRPFSFIFPTYQSFLWTRTQSRRIPRTLTFSRAGLEAEQYPWACLYILDYCEVIEKDQHLMTCLLILSLASKPYKNKQSKILLRVSNTMLPLSK